MSIKIQGLIGSLDAVPLGIQGANYQDEPEQHQRVADALTSAYSALTGVLSEFEALLTHTMTCYNENFMPAFQELQQGNNRLAQVAQAYQYIANIENQMAEELEAYDGEVFGQFAEAGIIYDQYTAEINALNGEGDFIAALQVTAQQQAYAQQVTQQFHEGKQQSAQQMNLQQQSAQQCLPQQCLPSTI